MSYGLLMDSSVILTTLVVSRKESKAFMSAEPSGSTEVRDGGSVSFEPRLMLQSTESGG